MHDIIGCAEHHKGKYLTDSLADSLLLLALTNTNTNTKLSQGLECLPDFARSIVSARSLTARPTCAKKKTEYNSLYNYMYDCIVLILRLNLLLVTTGEFNFKP